MPTITMGNSAIFSKLHRSANAEVDAIDAPRIANIRIGKWRSPRLPRALIGVFAAAFEQDGVGKDTFEAVTIVFLRVSLARVPA
jgi:hypothetical protein